MSSPRSVSRSRATISNTSTSNLATGTNAIFELPAERLRPKRAEPGRAGIKVLDQRREQGQVWIRIVWQTGATSEHSIRRDVQAYTDYADLDRLEQPVDGEERIGQRDAAHDRAGHVTLVPLVAGQFAGH